MGFYGTGPCTEGSGNAVDGAQKNFTEEYWRKWRQKYYANIVQIDEYIQKIIQKATAIWHEDLYIVFTADHGDMMGNHSLWGKNSSVYDDVLRVPLMIHHPGQRQRKDIFERVSSVDVFPTLLAMGGAQLPEHLDGAALGRVVAQGGRDCIISVCEGRVAILKGHMKLCLNGVGFEMYKPVKVYRELYDLQSDPYEFCNLYGKPDYAEIQRDLQAMLQEDPALLRTVFYRCEDRPYWLNLGHGAGYPLNKL